MSPATVATIIINPPQITNQFHKFLACKKTPFLSPHICKFNKFGKLVKLKTSMTSGSIESGGRGDEYVSSAFEQEVNLIENGGVTFHQTLGGLHALANHLSKWIVAVMYSIFILLRHDAFALWAVIGSVLNMILSVVLKKILKQERPVSGVSSGHGMPSSHAQSIFFAIVFVTLSGVQWQGLNGVTAIFSMLLLTLGSYFSWLRVSQRYHTTSQVVVGSVVGSIFSVVWFWAWEASVHKAYNSSLWVRILLLVGTAFFCLGFIQHVIRDWIKGKGGGSRARVEERVREPERVHRAEYLEYLHRVENSSWEPEHCWVINFEKVERLSKWIVAGTLGGIILLRHDALALWAATGSVSNFILSISLKKILKQERPVSEVSSGHGMPSSHSQSIFFTLVFVILSVVEWMGLNGATTILNVLIVALASYFLVNRWSTNQ